MIKSFCKTGDSFPRSSVKFTVEQVKRYIRLESNSYHAFGCALLLTVFAVGMAVLGTHGLSSVFADCSVIPAAGAGVCFYLGVRWLREKKSVQENFLSHVSKPANWVSPVV